MAHPRSTQDPAGGFGGLGRAKTTLADGEDVFLVAPTVRCACTPHDRHSPGQLMNLFGEMRNRP